MGGCQLADKSRPEPEADKETAEPVADAAEQAPGTTEPGESKEATGDPSTEDEAGQAQTGEAGSAVPEGASDDDALADTTTGADLADSGGASDAVNSASAQPAPVAHPPAERIVEKRGGFGAALLGGVLAAALGFVAARSAMLDPVLPAAWRSANNQEAVEALQAGLASQGGAIEALRARIAAVPPAPDLAPVAARIDDLSGRADALAADLAALSAGVDELRAQVADLETRLNAVEKRPVTDSASPAAVAAYERELAALRESLAAQREEVDRMVATAKAKEAEARAIEERAAAEAKLAAARAALARLRSAVESGAPYAAELSELRAAGLDGGDALAAGAADGVASMAALRASFPPAARDALAAARQQSGDGNSFTAFLQRQLGARSVAPREGDDPDAILSRAEAALVAGDLRAALAEMDALPDPALSAMSGWLARARARQAALDAVDSMNQSLNSN